MTGSGGASILIADDEPALLKLVEMYLKRRGFRTTIVETAEGAAEAIAASPEGFDVAVIDATLEGADLAVFLSRLLALSSRLRFVVASGYPVDVAAIEEAVRGRVTFLQKPFGPEALAQTIRSALGQKEDV